MSLTMQDRYCLRHACTASRVLWHSCISLLCMQLWQSIFKAMEQCNTHGIQVCSSRMVPCHLAASASVALRVWGLFILICQYISQLVLRSKQKIAQCSATMVCALCGVVWRLRGSLNIFPEAKGGLGGCHTVQGPHDLHPPLLQQRLH